MKRHLRQKNNRTYSVITFISVALLLTGCNKKDVPAPVAPTTPPPVQAGQQPKPVLKAVTSAVKLNPPPAGNQFDFSGKKDPFKPDITVKPLVAPKPEDQKKASFVGLPIHSFDVSQFKLIGVVTGAKDNQAMVVDPNGKGYVLKIGMTIGKNEGRVTAINTAGVDVVEQFKDDSGRVRKEVIKITLPRKQ